MTAIIPSIRDERDNAVQVTTYDAHCALVRAVIARAYWDSLGRIGMSSYKTEERRYAIMRDGSLFFKDGRCRHFLELIDCDPDKLGALGL